MRLILAMRGGGVEWMGGAEYIKNLVLALSRLPERREGALEVNLLAPRTALGGEADLLASHVRTIYYAEEHVAPPTTLNRIRWKFDHAVRKIPDPPHQKFFDSGAFDFAYPHVGPRAAAGHVRSAAWIPDFQHAALTQFFDAHEIRVRDHAFAQIAENAATVVLSSRCAEQDFKRLFPTAANRAKVLSFHTVPQHTWYESDPGSVVQKYNLPSRYFLVSNQFWKHKNHLLVFEALRILRAGGIAPPIVCTGHINDYRHPMYGSEVLQALHADRLHGQVYLLGLMPRHEQIQLMRRALAVVQPSLFEGWSTVVEDARCLGKRILLSDIPVHREQAPPLVSYFDPAHAEALAGLMRRMWEEDGEGYDAGREANAREAQEALAAAFARDFLAIAQQARSAP